MRNIFYSFFLVCTTAFTQNYELVDNKVLEYPSFSNLKSVSDLINADFNTETNKARAAFTWIANNISYDIETYKKPKVFSTILYFSEKDYERQYKARLKRKVELALITKKTLCEGYSAMFVELCELLNLESITIKGISKVSPSQINSNKKTKNHAWNAVKVNGKWQLIDLTWSSGFIEETSGELIDNFNDFYFFTKPEHFITSHFPEFEKWQLLDKPISLKTYYERPIFYSHYYKSDLVLNKKHKGNIRVSKNQIVLNFSQKDKKEDLYYKFSGDKYVKVLKVKKNNNGSFDAIVNYKKNKEDILTLFVNYNAVIDFKIN